MSVTIITHLHASTGQEDVLAGLLAEGRDRMRSADGCESFELVQDVQGPCSFAFCQHWAPHQDHDAAFNERIVQTGHINEALAALNEPLVQHTYHVVS
jgi:quinol monooxygenase YgiN